MFLPRDAMRKRGLCCRLVSVCLSVTLVDCIHTAEDIAKLLSRPASPIILVFYSRRRYPFPLQRGLKIHGGGWENFAIFDGYRRLFRKRYVRAMER